ncbi:MAG: hypothetical protein ACTSU5_05060 [Promethearchaeota archaeon]
MDLTPASRPFVCRPVPVGFDDRWVVVPSGGRWRVRLHRKRCEKCGVEVRMDLGRLAPRGKTCHENFPRGARQLYLAALVPRQIRDAFRVPWDVEVPASTITGWIYDAAEPLRELHATTVLPSSGTWHHGETYLRVAGRRAYATYPRDGARTPPTRGTRGPALREARQGRPRGFPPRMPGGGRDDELGGSPRHARVQGDLGAALQDAPQVDREQAQTVDDVVPVE